jgi:hypothetical protein
MVFLFFDYIEIWTSFQFVKKHIANRHNSNIIAPPDSQKGKT